VEFIFEGKGFKNKSKTETLLISLAGVGLPEKKVPVEFIFEGKGFKNKSKTETLLISLAGVGLSHDKFKKKALAI
jgi:hypothetical protein